MKARSDGDPETFAVIGAAMEITSRTVQRLADKALQEILRKLGV